MKKYLALVLAIMLVLPMAICFAGCGKSEGSVYYLNFKPEADAAWQQLAKTYTEKTGVEVKVVTAASGTYNEVLTAEMDKENPPPSSSAETRAQSRPGVNSAMIFPVPISIRK